MTIASRAASKAINRMLKALDDFRIELIAARRELAEADEADKTPVRPPSRTDMRAAFANANEHADKAAAALKNPMKGEP